MNTFVVLRPFDFAIVRFFRFLHLLIMPTREKSNLSQYSKNRKRQEESRSQDSEKDREPRLAGDREH